MKENKYIPSFREIYYKDYLNHDGFWFLLSNLKKLTEPIKCLKGKFFRFLSENGPVLITGSHLRLNCFAFTFPEIDNNNLFKPDPKDLQDLHLKEWLIEGIKSKNKGFHETNLQDAILVDLLSRGYIFSREGFLEEKSSKFRGRYDFLVQKNNRYYAIETKVDDDVNAPFQLEKYINVIVNKGEIPREKIEGIIICGRASNETKQEAKRRGFRVYEYKFNLNIPSIIESL